jgi:ubiquinol-cytochrome c reductase cytochrome b subunit
VVGPPRLGALPDPTNLQAYPRPDWYFLWYFALLALIPNSIEDAFILGFPLLVAVLMLALPFIASTGERSPWRRPWAPAIVGLAALSIALLVRQGAVAPWSPNLNPGPLPARVTANLTPAQRHGAFLFQQRACHTCHMVAGTGGLRGPDLTNVGARLTRQQLITRILGGGYNMPAYAGTISPQDLSDLVDFLQSLKG